MLTRIFVAEDTAVLEDTSSLDSALEPKRLSETTFEAVPAFESVKAPVKVLRVVMPIIEVLDPVMNAILVEARSVVVGLELEMFDAVEAGFSEAS